MKIFPVWLLVVAVFGEAARSATPSENAIFAKMRRVTETLQHDLDEILASEDFGLQGLRRLQIVETNITEGNGTLGPTPAPFVSPWVCFRREREDGVTYECAGVKPDYMRDSLPANTYPFYVCAVDLSLPEYEGAAIQDHCLDVPTSGLYGFCLIIDLDTREFCSACNLLPNGETAYNCENLYSSSACSSRNDLGECGDFDGWNCLKNFFGNGEGYLCGPYNNNVSGILIPAGELLPKLPTNISNELAVQLWCEHPVSGRNTLDRCGYHHCTLSTFGPNRNIDGFCRGCKFLSENAVNINETLLAGKNVFAYDCADVFPDEPCTTTDVNGECVQLKAEWETLLDECNYLPAPAVEAENESNWMEDWKSWTIVSIEARAFNIVSSLIALVTRSLVGLGMALAYPMLVSWYLQRPKHRRVPLAALDGTGAGLLSTARLVRAAKGALPTVFLFLALAIADFSHPIADFGFDFVQIEKEGEIEPVWSLRTEHRNPNRPMETMGDPPGQRTFIEQEVDGLNPNRSILVVPQTEHSLAGPLLEAANLIARGSSPFSSKFLGTIQNEVTYFGVDSFSVRVGIPCEASTEQVPLPIIEIPLEIPLSCESSGMVRIPQILVGLPYVEPLRHVALIPNCTLTEARSTGIYEPTQSAQILEWAANYIDFLYADINQYTSIDLIVNGNLTKTFLATPEDKKLARDRIDWKQGRRVSGVDGVQIGNKTIGFSTVILATGGEYNTGAQSLTEEANLKSYRLFATLIDGCPERPSGYPVTPDMACFATAILKCPTFQEDDDLPSDLYFVSSVSSECEFKSIQFIWGKNFVMDDDLLAAIAGVYGMVRPSEMGEVVGDFNLHGALAGLFILGSLDGRPSVKTVVRAEVNILYVISMLVPFVLAVGCFIIALMLCQNKLTIPGSTWEFLVFGRENPDLPTRRCKRDKFPTPRDLYLECGPSRPGSKTKALIITGNTMNAALQNNAIVEIPVADDDEEKKIGQVGTIAHSASEDEEVASSPEPIAEEEQEQED